MFGRIVQATFRGLLQWPDLMVFGLLSFGLSLIITALTTPLWEGVITQTDTVIALDSPALAGLLLIAQQLVLTVGSMLIAVAATRVALARLRGQQLSILDAMRLGGLLRPTLTYSLLYGLISALISLAYLYVLFGALGMRFAALTSTTGLSGLAQVPTTGTTDLAIIALLIFFPILIVWSLANLLVAPVIAAEHSGGLTAVWRSWVLVRRTFMVIVGLIALGFAAACVLSLVLSFVVAASGGINTLDTTTPVLPELPGVLSAFLNALVFMLGVIFNSAWYLLAAADHDEATQFTAQ